MDIENIMRGRQNTRIEELERKRYRKKLLEQISIIVREDQTSVEKVLSVCSTKELERILEAHNKKLSEIARPFMGLI